MKKITLTPSELVLVFVPALLSSFLAVRVLEHQSLAIKAMAGLLSFVAVLGLFMWVFFCFQKTARSRAALLLKSYRLDNQKERRIVKQLREVALNEHLTKVEREAISAAIDVLSK